MYNCQNHKKTLSFQSKFYNATIYFSMLTHTIYYIRSKFKVITIKWHFNTHLAGPQLLAVHARSHHLIHPCPYDPSPTGSAPYLPHRTDPVVSPCRTLFPAPWPALFPSVILPPFLFPVLSLSPFPVPFPVLFLGAFLLPSFACNCIIMIKGGNQNHKKIWWFKKSL